MTEFKTELKKRLMEGQGRLQVLRLKADKLEDELNHVRALYEIEQEKSGEVKAPPPPPPLMTGLTVRDVILKTLADGMPRTSAELINEILKTGLLHDSKSPKRSLQAILMNLVRYDEIKKTNDNRAWIIK